MYRWVILGMVILFGVFLFLPKEMELPNEGPVPDIHLTSLNGSSHSFYEPVPKVVVFFYADCPDICPLTIWDLKKLRKELVNRGVEDDHYEILLITLNPAVDTVSSLISYRDKFDANFKNWRFLRGSDQDVESLAEAFGMVFRKEGRVVSHSTTLYLVDRNGNIRSKHAMATSQKPMDVREVADHIERLQ
ncbi:SCO family protein [Halobacillus locisalis]|uniref:SCO family protein n=1 Tax=Halobacillus locisalis TaxID=220753 RepID=A0A838CVW6_9BACI|nr:SCO family protein [Halobacillus locisalis]MBA2176078.1 SCO family protein [Halobacillus locisalis]